MTSTADALQAVENDIVDLWWRLGPDGPTFGSPDAGAESEARTRYLTPLSRVLLGAVRGSAEHRAVYLDERLRYAVDATEGAQTLRRSLAREIPEIASLCTDAGTRAAVEHDLWELHADVLAPPATADTVVFIGDCLFVETRAFLAPLARDAGRAVDIRQAFFSARQPLAARNTAIVELVERAAPQLVGISLFTFEGIPPWALAWRQAAVPFRGRHALRLVDGLVKIVDETIEDIRSVSDCTIAVHVPSGLPLDPVRRRLRRLPAHSRSQRRLLAALGDALTELVEGSLNTVLVDERRVVAGEGVRAYDAPAFDPADVPEGYFHTTRLGPALAEEYDGLLADLALLGKAKAVLVDFDNTLWSGVMADGEVTHDVAAQRLLLQLRNAGVVLVALSKNSPEAIRWDEMLLKPDDFALLKINWKPKPDNVAEAVAELDLAPGAFVLLDDNPVERALVTENVAGVRALDPAEPATWRALRRWLDFPSTTQTDEARRRTAMYREAAARRSALNATHDYGAMMASLGLVFDFRPAGDDDADRVLELVQRTNQFNTTTRRRSAGELGALRGSDDAGVYVASLKDRFGDLGVVGVATFDRPTRTIDSFVMSCRAMGFGLETGFLRRVLDAEGPGDVVGEFVPTDRNGPAASVFGAAGFTEVRTGHWVLGADDPRPEIPAWLASTTSR